MKQWNRVYTAEESRELDRLAIQSLGFPSFTLMQRAGQFAFDCLISEWPKTRSIHVVAGSGNNAGDGFVVASLAHKDGLRVTVQSVGSVDRLAGDARKAYLQLTEQDIVVSQEVEPADVIVDALLGTGAKASIREPYQTAIEQINSTDKNVVALDVPSGINASTGGLLTENPVRAKLTCSFVCPKIGTLTGPGIDYCGELHICDLGIPQEIYEKVSGIPVLESSRTVNSKPKHKPTAHKYNKGCTLIIGGDHSMGGAIILAAEAAQRAGAGLVRVLTRKEHLAPLLSRCPECIVAEYNDNADIAAHLTKADVVALGPGLGTRSWGESVFQEVIQNQPKKLVIDADGLRLLKHSRSIDLSHAILTPHAGEAARMLDSDSKTVNQDRPSFAKKLSKTYCCTVVLKGAGSFIAKDGEIKYLSTFANPALATAGSGDVLTGLIAGNYLNTEDPVEAAQVGMLLHQNACIRAERHAEHRVLLARDLIANIHFGDMLS